MASEWLLINHLGILLHSPARHFPNGRGCTLDLNSGGSVLSKDLVNEGLCKLFFNDSLLAHHYVCSYTQALQRWLIFREVSCRTTVTSCSQ